MIFADLKHLSSKIVRVRDHENWNSLVNKVEEEQRTTMKKKKSRYMFSSTTSSLKKNIVWE